jgi:hypothetical protein
VDEYDRSLRDVDQRYGRDAAAGEDERVARGDSGIVCPAIIISLVVGFPYLTDDLTTFGKPRFVNKTPTKKGNVSLGSRVISHHHEKQQHHVV